MWPSVQAHIGHRIVVVPSVTRKGSIEEKEEKHTHTHSLDTQYLPCVNKLVGHYIKVTYIGSVVGDKE